MSGRIKGWDRVIADAQQLKHETFGGVRYERIKYGIDYPNGRPTCRDCGVEHGQYHVVDCCVEVCPACGCQAMCCGCAEASEAPTQ